MQQVHSSPYADARDYLLALQDGLIERASAREAVDFACELLGRQLGVASVGLIELEPQGAVGYVFSEWLSGALPSMRGRHAVDAYGPERLAVLSEGRSVVVADAQAEVQAENVRKALDAIGVSALVEAPLVANGVLRGWLYVSSVEPRAWAPSDVDLVMQTAKRTWHAAERARAEERLREREARLQAVLDQIPVGVILAAMPDGELLLYNKASTQIMGHEMLGASLPAYGTYGGVHPDGRPYAAEEYPTARALLHRESVIDEPLVYRRPDGQLINLSVSATPIDTAFDSYALCTFSDETAYLAAEARSQLLANELNHRVKNIMTIVQAIAAQTFGPSALRGAFEERLTALAAAHDLITTNEWSGSLEDLVRVALEPFALGGRILIGGDSVHLNDAHTVPFALALHELATNAAKYGALSSPEGRVEVRWTLDDDRNLTFRWSETGGPIVTAPTRRGFGSRMIERGLAGELKGNAQLDFQPSGLVCQIQARL